MTTENKSQQPDNNSRRHLLLGAAAAATTLAAGQSFATSAHQHHHSQINTSLVDSALDCLKKGQACNDHCIELVKQGDTSIADCMEQNK
ncbi:MAG: hypothetical protein OEY36_04345 [Gammaproteobacteria bacterium]|nr:hypothetical protein [Gammaproteobacteria bacterium]